MGFLGSKRGDDCLEMRILIDGDRFWWWCCWKLSRMKGLTYIYIYIDLHIIHMYIYIYVFAVHIYIYMLKYIHQQNTFCTAVIYQVDKNTRWMIPILTNYSTYLKRNPVEQFEVLFHQEFQVPEMEGFRTNLIAGCFGGWENSLT